MSANFRRFGEIAATSPETFNWEWFGRLLERNLTLAVAGRRRQRHRARQPVVNLAEWRKAVSSRTSPTSPDRAA
jgi:hypothetical protein